MAGSINGTVVVVNNATGVVVGQGDFTHTYDGKLIEVTTKDSGDGTNYMEGENSGKQHIFSGEFIYNGETQFRNTRADVFSVTARQYTLVYVSDLVVNESFVGDFFPTDLNDVVPQGGAMKTTIAFKSNSVVTHINPPAAPSDYIAYWTMDEASGNPQDISGNGHHVTTIGGTPVYSKTGQIGNAIELDDSDFLEVTNTAALRPTSFTVSVWIKPIATTATGYIFGSLQQTSAGPGNSYGFVFSQGFSDSSLILSFGDGTNSLTAIDSNYVPPDGVWSHAVCSYNGTTVKIYSNGVERFSGASGTTMIYDTANRVIIGAKSTSDSSVQNHWQGDLDDLQFYDRVLTQSEITNIYENGII